MAENNDIEQVSEIDGISDTDGKDDFTETGQAETNQPQKATGAKYDSVREAYRSTDGFLSGIGEVIRNTALGRNTVGRAAGIGLDIAEILLPIGKVSKLREAGKKALNLNKDKNDMKDAIKRAFTRDGGGFFRVKDEDDNITATSVGAFVIRMVVVGLIAYGLHLLGVPVTELVDIIPE